MNFLDSSIWLAHLLESNLQCSEIIESDVILYSSILTLFEVKKKLIKENFDKEKIILSINFIKKRSMIININEEIINIAINISIKNNLSAIDSLIYASALKMKAKFITADNDFRNLEYAEVINK